MHSDMSCCSTKSRNKAVGLLLIRVAVGIIFAVHGYAKLFGSPTSMTMVTGMVANLGFPIPAFFAWVIALAEFLGGISLILGIFVCFFTPILAIDMLVAFGAVKGLSLPKGDIEFMLLMASIALFFTGPGMISLKSKLKMGKMKMFGGKMEDKKGACGDGGCGCGSGGCGCGTSGCGSSDCGCGDGTHKH